MRDLRIARNELTGSNNFEFIRIAAAILVILGHSYPLCGITYVPVLGYIEISTWAVWVFFSLSGYLVTVSYYNSKSVIEYIGKRASRIFPGLLLTVILTIFLGSFVASIGFKSYWLDLVWLSYLRNILLFPIYSFGGIFIENPYSGIINGSLWTIPIEFACYLLIPILIFRKYKKTSLFLTGLAAFSTGVLSIILPSGEERIVFYGTSIKDACSVSVFFFVASLLAHLKKEGLLRIDFGFLAIVSAVFVFTMKPTFSLYFIWLFLPIAVVSFGLQSTPVLNKLRTYGDPSYGIYLYGFPIQQFVVQHFPNLTHAASVLLVLFMTVPLSYLSWWKFERHFLRRLRTSK